MRSGWVPSGTPRRKYDIEIWMGTEWNTKKKYVLKGWDAESYAKVDNVNTSIFTPAN